MRSSTLLKPVKERTKNQKLALLILENVLGVLAFAAAIGIAIFLAFFISMSKAHAASITIAIPDNTVIWIISAAILAYFISWIAHGKLFKRIKDTYDFIQSGHYGWLQAWRLSENTL